MDRLNSLLIKAEAQAPKHFYVDRVASGIDLHVELDRALKLCTARYLGILRLDVRTQHRSRNASTHSKDVATHVATVAGA